MSKNHVITIASIILFLAGTAHLVRIFYGWEMIIGDWNAPIWISYIASIICIFLSYNLLKLKNTN